MVNASHPLSSKRAMLAVILSLAGLLSCNKSSSPTETNPPPPNTGGIGTAGGVVSSSDSVVSVVIPPGALSSSVNISIQSVPDSMPSGIGGVFSLLPEGTVFNIPVTLKIRYVDSLLTSKNPFALGVAYKNGAGQWMSVGHGSVDTATKTIMVPITHFSRWGAFEAYRIEPSRQVLFTDASLPLFVYRYSSAVMDSVGGVPIPAFPTLLTPNQWLVNGIHNGNADVGSVSTASQSNSGEYDAPASTPTANPIAVDAQVILENLSVLYLRCNVTVLAPNWVLVYHRTYIYPCPGAGFSWTYEDSCSIQFSLDENFQTGEGSGSELGFSLRDVNGCQPGITVTLEPGEQTHFNGITGGYDQSSKMFWFNVDITEAAFPGITMYLNGNQVSHTDPRPGTAGGGRQPYPPQRSFTRSSSSPPGGTAQFQLAFTLHEDDSGTLINTPARSRHSVR